MIAHEQRWRIHEVPIEWHFRDRSQVSLVRDSSRMLRDLLRLWVKRTRGGYDRSLAPALSSAAH